MGDEDKEAMRKPKEGKCEAATEETRRKRNTDIDGERRNA